MTTTADGTPRPGFWNRVAARLEGEVPADLLEAYRRAGLGVYGLLDELEDERLTCKIKAVHPWSLPAATQAALLCAWNAFELQTLGDQFLDADYAANPATVGYVPPVTAEQVGAFYGEVEGWLGRARQARSTTSYELDVAVPADLPPWSIVEPCPAEHRAAMLAAARSLRKRADAALMLLNEMEPPDEWRSAAQQLRQLQAAATSKVEYAEQLTAAGGPREMHERVEALLRDGLARYYHLGQLVAMPRLIAEYGRRPAQPAQSPLSAKGGFDPWRITDPATRAQWKADSRAREALDSMWALDPDPRRTLAIQDAIDEALARGDVAYATSAAGQRVGNYFCCPWAPVYVARRPTTIHGTRLKPLQQFTYDVSAEEVPGGGEFKREILVGLFSRADEVDYCDGREDGD